MSDLFPPVPKEWSCLLYPDMEVAACEWGPEESTRNILLIHGWMDSSASFFRIAPILSKRIPTARIVAIDLPGHGKSSHRPPGSFYYFTDYIGDVHAFVVNHLKWTQFDIIGHSMGGNVGMLLAAAFPELVHRLVMIDILGPVPTLPANQAAHQLRKGILERSMAFEHIQKGPKLYASVDETVSRLKASEWTSSMRDDSIRVFVSRQVKKSSVTDAASGNVKEGFVFLHDTKLRASPPARLSEEQIYSYASAIKCQVLIIGTMAYERFKKHDPNWVKKRVEAFHSVEIVERNAGHHPHLDEPEPVADIIFQFYGEPEIQEELAAEVGLEEDNSIPRLE